MALCYLAAGGAAPGTLMMMGGDEAAADGFDLSRREVNKKPEAAITVATRRWLDSE